MSAPDMGGSGAVPHRPDRAAMPGLGEGQPAVAPVRPDLRVVEPRLPAPVRRRRLVRFAVFAGGTFVAAVVFGLVGVHVLLAQNQFTLDRLNARSAVEEARYQRLRLQVDQLESPQRIVATAEGRLGMVAPPAVKYLTPSRPPTSPTRSASVPGRTALALASPSTTIPPAGEGPGDWAAVKPQLVARQ
jgi:cell division protein FtsB